MFRSSKTFLPILALLLVSPIYCVDDILPITTTPDPETTTIIVTTTPAVTTTPQTTTSTTTAPQTTTTTVAPITPAPSQVGNWNVTDKNNVTCMMIQASIQISVVYMKTDNKTGIANLTIPAVGSTVSGTCDNETQSISIAWKPAGLAEGQSDKLDITFSLNGTTKAYHVSKLSISVYPTNFPGAAGKDVITLESSTIQTQIPPIPLAMSYRCTPVESFNLTGNSFLEITDLQLQAFHTAGDGKFGAASDCNAGDTADIVPIVVGCALAGLVVIVLIAYLVGRRRSRQSGYLSM